MSAFARKKQSFDRLVLPGLLLTAFLVSIYLTQSQRVFADSVIDWSSAGQITVNSGTPVDTFYDSNALGCVDQIITIRYKDGGNAETIERNGCVVTGENLLLAYASYGSSNKLVSYDSGDNFYELDTRNTGTIDLKLVPDSDRYGMVRTSRARAYVEVHDGLSDRLTFDPVTLKYKITDWTGRFFPASGEDRQGGVSVNFSRNGRYMVYQSRSDYPGINPRLIRVDLQTGEKKEFGRMWYGNYVSSIPDPHFAISNDGNHIIGGGVGTLRAWHIDDSCLIDVPNYSNGSSVDACPSRNISKADYGEATTASTRTYRLELNDESSELSFIYHPIREEWKRISISPANYTPPDIPQLEYLALGDSFSSGEGDIADWPTNYYLNGTENDGDCHLSSRSYPFLLRDMWAIDPSDMRSVACSGAKVEPDFYGEGDVYIGQGERYALLDDEQLLQAQNQALENFIPGTLRQLEFVEKYKPVKLTFTAGGNDVGFADVLTYCITGSLLTCGYASDSQLRADLNRQIDEQYIANRRLIEKIQDISPTTAIYMIGYPQFISNGPLCLHNSPILNSAERTMIRESVSRLNNVLKKVAYDMGVYYVDVESSLKGGQICDGSAYMTGPIRVVTTKHVLRDYNMYHPNHRGHAKIAESITQKIDSGMEYNIIDIPTETKGRRVIRTAVMPDYAGVGSTHTITMDSSMFQPDGTVEIDMFSQHIHLGQAVADNNGGFHAAVTIPSNVEVGTHLLALSGVATDGEVMSMQQFITVTSSIPGDADGDGISDDKDICFAVSEWHKADVNICAPTDDQTGAGVYGNKNQASEFSNNRVVARGIIQNLSEIALNDQFNNRSVLPAVPWSNHVGRDINDVGTAGIPQLWWIFGSLGIITVGAVMHYVKRKTDQSK